MGRGWEMGMFREASAEEEGDGEWRCKDEEDASSYK